MKNTIKLMLTAITIVIVGTSFIGCTGVNITGMTVSQAQVEMVIGETFTPEIELEFDNAEASQEQIDTAIEAAGITWASSDEDIIKVVDGGVEAVAPGEAVVTIKDSSDAMTLNIDFVVVEYATDIEVPETIDLVIGSETTETMQIETTIAPVNAIGEVSYEVVAVEDNSNEDGEAETATTDIITINETGLVTAVANGSATIKVLLSVSGEEVTTKEIVVNVTTQAADVGLDADVGWIYVGSSYQITPFPIPETALAEYTFVSRTENVATVSDNGTISGVSVGTAEIVVTDNYGNEKIYTMTVKAVLVYTAPASTGGGSTAPAPAPTPTPTPAPTTPPVDTGLANGGDPTGGGGFGGD